MVGELWTFTSKATLFSTLNQGINKQNTTSAESYGEEWSWSPGGSTAGKQSSLPRTTAASLPEPSPITHVSLSPCTEILPVTEVEKR